MLRCFLQGLFYTFWEEIIALKWVLFPKCVKNLLILCTFFFTFAVFLLYFALFDFLLLLLKKITPSPSFSLTDFAIEWLRECHAYKIFEFFVTNSTIITVTCKSALHKKCPYSELFWSVISRIRTECGSE